MRALRHGIALLALWAALGGPAPGWAEDRPGRPPAASRGRDKDQDQDKDKQAKAAGTGPAAIISEDELQARIKKHRGRVLVLHFWATWCVPCLEEIPLISDLIRSSGPRGVDILSISLDDPTEQAAAHVGRILGERGGEAMTNTIVRVEDADTFLKGIDSRWEGTIPAFFVHDRKGILRRAFIGEMTRAHFDKLVADMVGPVVKK